MLRRRRRRLARPSSWPRPSRRRSGSRGRSPRARHDRRRGRGGDARRGCASSPARNRLLRSYLGMGYHASRLPGVIQRNVLENPGWYTQYTPYQAEISQGRLEALLNFQTMVADLTGLPIANASLLDEATAAAEAMHLAAAAHPALEKIERPVFFVADACHPQTIAVVRTRAAAIGIEVRVGDPFLADFASGRIFGVLVQYPTTDGRVLDYAPLAERAHAGKALLVVACRPARARPAAAARRVRRRRRGRLDPALRSADGLRRAARRLLRHPRRVQAPDAGAADRRLARTPPAAPPTGWRCRRASSTSAARRRPRTSAPRRCCSAILAVMYAIYHGPEGLARASHGACSALAAALAEGRAAARPPAAGRAVLRHAARRARARMPPPTCSNARCARGINLRRLDDRTVGVALDETVGADDLRDLLAVLAAATRSTPKSWRRRTHSDLPAPHARSSELARAPGLPPLPHRARDAALHATARVARPVARALDDSARLVHDEAQRHLRDGADLLARARRPASVRAPRPGAGLPRDRPAARALAGRDHRLRRRFAAAERRARRANTRDCS